LSLVNFDLKSCFIYYPGASFVKKEAFVKAHERSGIYERIRNFFFTKGPFVSFRILSYPFVSFRSLSYPFVTFRILSWPFVAFWGFLRPILGYFIFIELKLNVNKKNQWINNKSYIFWIFIFYQKIIYFFNTTLVFHVYIS
jgi:hypothetical protein